MSIVSIPLGSDVLRNSFEDLKNHYNRPCSEGTRGVLEMVGRSIVVVPAHLLSAVVVGVAYFVTDAVIATLFALAACFTFDIYPSLSTEAEIRATSATKILCYIAAHALAFLPPLGYELYNQSPAFEF
ncbi:MAG: hypothetical protein P4L16_03380 [Chlamydiales bacterium]|nr:hypothetical protein [Chlamydiales bacterium]